jgi:SOUL heme-binding protein
MKTFLIILSSLVVLFIIFQAYTTMSTNKSEEQPHKVIRTEKDFEIRFYPSVTMATITSSAKSYKELGSSGFRKLAGYIFGGNDAKKQIAMTSPVHMDINDSISSMSFVMPSAYNADSLPKPNDATVNINKTADEYVAAIKFSGFASDEDIKNQTERLKNALKAASITYYGNFRYLGYNPPYQLVGRRNEVIINVNWDAK